jgi:hypothetical protein
MATRSSRRRGEQGIKHRVCAAAGGLLIAGLLATVVAPTYSADPGLPFTEDFEFDSLKDADKTTANWNTGSKQLLLPTAASLTGQTFSETSEPLSFGTATTRSVALGDLNGDGHLDLVAGLSGRNRVYLNDGAGNFTHVFTTMESDNTRAVAIGDVNGDGSLDFAAVNFGRQARVYLNDGTGGSYVMQLVTSQVINVGDDIALVDINGNGLLDVVIAAGDSQFQEANRLVLNTGDPVYPFGPAGSEGIVLDSSVVEATRGVVVGDVDKDGDLDIVFLNQGAPDRIYMQVDPGACSDEVCFVHEQIDPADASHRRAGALGDLNGNGYLDLVVVSRDDGEDSKIYYNQIAGPDNNPFTQPGEVFLPAIAGAQPLDVKLADINNNGLLDIVVVLSGFPHRNRIYFNDQDNPGSFPSFVEIGPDPALGEEFQTNTVDVGDLNGDGRLDLVFGNQAVQPNNDPRPTHVFLNAGVADGDEALQLRAYGTSVAVNNGEGGTIQSVRLTADTAFVAPQFHNYVDFWVSSNGGDYWAPIRPNGKPINIASPGNDLRWRAVLRSVSPMEAGALAVNQLTLDVNALPVAADDQYVVNQDDVLDEPAPGVLANDTDADVGDELTAVLVQTPANGALVLNADGSFTYTPNAGFFGQDTFTYRATDGALSNVATVSITVLEAIVPGAPSFTSTPVLAVTAAQEYLYQITTEDPNGDDVTISAVALPAWLTLTDNGDGTAELRGTPAAGQVGQHTVALMVQKDPAVDGLSETQEFVITVSSASAPPPPPPPPPPSSSRRGGGSLGLETLALLLLAAAAGVLRRRRWRTYSRGA